MSSVEEVSDPPPDKADIDKEKEENTSDSELTASKTETESNSLTGSWTLLEKDDDNPLKVHIICFMSQIVLRTSGTKALCIK